jgi:hypothetical protein
MKSTRDDVYPSLSFHSSRMSCSFVSHASLAPFGSVISSAISKPIETAVKSLLQDAIVKTDYETEVWVYVVS